MTLFSSRLTSLCLTLHFDSLLGPISQEPGSPRNTAASSIKHRHVLALAEPCFLSTRLLLRGPGAHAAPNTGEGAACSSARCYRPTENRGGDRGEEDIVPMALFVVSCSRRPCPSPWNGPTALYRNRNTPTDGQTDRRGFTPSRGGGALCHAPAAAPCSPQIPSSSSPSLSAKSSPCFLAPDPGDQTRGDTTAQNREQNRERIQKQHDCSVAQQAGSGPGPRTGRRDGKN